MAIEITIPRLGWSTDEVAFLGWLKRDGEAVRAGEPLFSLEGDKASLDVEAIDPGVLKIPPDAPAVGARVAVGAVIGYLVGPEETATVASTSPLAAGRRACRGTVASTPLARRIARELKVDWTRLAGSGNGGRVRKVDVLQALPFASRDGNGPAPTARSVPIGPVRKTIAARMVESLRTTAPVTLTTTVDATNLVNLRRQFQNAGPPGQAVPSYTDFVVKLAALALREHSMLNARWADDRIEVPDEAHVGIAVDTEAGLLVPVIRGATGLGLREIADRARDLINRARERRLTPDELRGGTFTVTNLGAFGVETFTPILNPPECAILGMGRIARQPVMDGDRIVPRDRMALSLTFDHRVVDGAPAARFLQALGRLIENPAPSLIG